MTTAPERWRLSDDEVRALVEARHPDPFAVLGLHACDEALVVRALVPGAEAVDVVARDGRPLGALAPRHPAGLFEGPVSAPPHGAYRLEARNGGGAWTVEDPYRFGPVLGELDDHLFVEGAHRQLWRKLGAHLVSHGGAEGVRFAVWAPHAQRVSVVGDFNEWDGRRAQMRKRVDSGVWEIFIPGVAASARYKYEIIAADGARLPLKADPFGFSAEVRPATASVVARVDDFAWGDTAYMAQRGEGAAWRRPMSIYEVHLGSWRRHPDGAFYSYDELAEALVPYAAEMGFTHLEFLPVSEHPLDDSWGYQPVGLFAPTRRFGDPAGFARLVDAAHRAGLGVILDWPGAHFPTDAHGLFRFDGTALYEHADPRQGIHPDWETAIFDFGRREVCNVLLANALYWLEVFHIDGLRVDAVASMLYLDYSRAPDAWVPNLEGGRENRSAEAFLRELNTRVYAEAPSAMTIAEESTTWPGVSRPVDQGGLGFGFKWNMGWMNDTLAYMGKDPIHRRFHHDKLTFGLVYAFSENFVLPLSHDEVVHGKGSIASRMPGDDWARLANVRAYLALMWGYPGKKLLFMGQEFGQWREWDFRAELDWSLLQQPGHAGLRLAVGDLNRLYRQRPALHARDCEPEGFAWLVVDDQAQSVTAWARFGGPEAAAMAVVCNFTPVVRQGYRLGLPRPGLWREAFNSDAQVYGGSGVGNLGAVHAEAAPLHGQPASAAVTLPPLSTLFLAHEPEAPLD